MSIIGHAITHTLNLSKDHYIKMFTDLFCYSKKLLCSHFLAVLHFFRMFAYLNKNEYTTHTYTCTHTLFLIIIIITSIDIVDTFRPKSHGFDFCSSRHVGTLGKSLTHNCL